MVENTIPSHLGSRGWSQSQEHSPGSLGVPQDPVCLLVQVGPGGGSTAKKHLKLKIRRALKMTITASHSTHQEATAAFPTTLSS